MFTPGRFKSRTLLISRRELQRKKTNTKREFTLAFAKSQSSDLPGLNNNLLYLV